MRVRATVHAAASLLIVLAGAAALCENAYGYDPSINYALHCMGCHTPDGGGVADRVPSVRDTLPRFSVTAAGRRYLVQVPGSSQAALTNAELAELLNWMIQNLGDWKTSPAFAPFTEREVASYRGQALVRVREARERLLREAPAR